jgi:hypothetical protein
MQTITHPAVGNLQRFAAIVVAAVAVTVIVLLLTLHVGGGSSSGTGSVHFAPMSNPASSHVVNCLPERPC